MKDILSTYEKKCNACTRCCSSVVFWPEIAFSCLQIALNTISGITTGPYMFLFSLFSFTAFLGILRPFAQRDEESAKALSKYSRLPGNPEETLENDTMGALGIEHASARVGGYQRGKRGHLTVISTNACNMF